MNCFFLMSLKQDSNVLPVDFYCLCNVLLYVFELVTQQLTMHTGVLTSHAVILFSYCKI